MAKTKMPRRPHRPGTDEQLRMLMAIQRRVTSLLDELLDEIATEAKPQLRLVPDPVS